MKPEELQIGDWVCWKGKPVQIAQISGIKYSFGHIDVALAHCNDSNILESHDIKSIEPIPITPEILLKNGLERDSFGRIWGAYFEEDEHERLEITVDDKTSEIWWSYNWDEYRIIKLEYLHQLQQAMRLCGIEKEIILN